MNSLSKREKVIILIFGIVLLGYAYYSFLYAPIQNKIASAKMNIDKYIQEIEAAKAQEKLIEQQKIELDDIKAKYEEANIALPQMEMNPEIVYNIKKFFEGSGVDVTSITIGSPAEMISQTPEAAPTTEGTQNAENTQSTDGTQSTMAAQATVAVSSKVLTVPVTISLSADNYDDAMNFVSLFEQDKRFVEITNIVITANRPAPAVAAAPQPSYASTTYANVIKKQPKDDEIPVIIVGEGEEYKAPAAAEEETDSYYTEQQAPVIQTPEPSVSAPVQMPKIVVNITAKYYYTDSNTGEKPAYSFESKVYGEKDLFKVK